MPRYGQLYAAAVLRPLAEQLAAALAVQPGDTVCDVMCDGGEFARVCTSWIGAAGRVVAADTDPGLAASVAAAVQAGGHGATALTLDAAAQPEEAVCDRAGCLLTGGFLPDVAATARRLVRSGGRALIACWEPGSPPPHEAALHSALQRCGVNSAHLDAVLTAPCEGSMSTPVHDVVRFDGFAACWAAMVDQRPVAAEVRALPDEALARVRTECRDALRRYEAADGTLRIPVDARFVEL